MVDCLGSQNRLNKGNPADHVDKLAIPSWEFPGTFVLKVLKVSPTKNPNGKGKPKVPHGESSPSSRYIMQNVIEVNVHTSYCRHGALEEICAKPDDRPKSLYDNREVLNILFNGSHENGGIIRI
jgi:hypothetical protein